MEQKDKEKMFLDLNSVLVKFWREQGRPDKELKIELLERMLNWYKKMGYITLDQKEICKESLHIPETCKENPDSLTLEEAAEEFAQKEYPLGFSGAEILPWRMGLKEGYEQAEKDLGWHPATEYPPEDEEVIVLTVPYGIKNFYEIQVSHILKGTKLWAIRDKVVWWMPMPKLPNEDE